VLNPIKIIIKRINEKEDFTKRSVGIIGKYSIQWQKSHFPTIEKTKIRRLERRKNGKSRVSREGRERERERLLFTKNETVDSVITKPFLPLSFYSLSVISLAPKRPKFLQHY